MPVSAPRLELWEGPSVEPKPETVTDGSLWDATEGDKEASHFKSLLFVFLHLCDVYTFKTSSLRFPRVARASGVLELRWAAGGLFPPCSQLLLQAKLFTQSVVSAHPQVSSDLCGHFQLFATPHGKLQRPEAR